MGLYVELHAVYAPANNTSETLSPDARSGWRRRHLPLECRFGLRAFDEGGCYWQHDEVAPSHAEFWVGSRPRRFVRRTLAAQAAVSAGPAVGMADGARHRAPEYDLNLFVPAGMFDEEDGAE